MQISPDKSTDACEKRGCKSGAARSRSDGATGALRVALALAPDQIYELQNQRILTELTNQTYERS